MKKIVYTILVIIIKNLEMSLDNLNLVLKKI